MRSKFFPGQSSFSTSGTRYKLSVYNINADSSASPDGGLKPLAGDSVTRRGFIGVKCLVVYDSVYGNTKTVAETIAEQIMSEGHSAEVRSARDGLPEKLDADLVFIGSPTRMARMTRRAKNSVKSLRKADWGGRPIVFFDTVMPKVEQEKGRWSMTASQSMHDMAKGLGLNADARLLHVEVTGIKGPLAENATEKTKGFTHDILSSIGR